MLHVYKYIVPYHHESILLHSSWLDRVAPETRGLKPALRYRTLVGHSPSAIGADTRSVGSMTTCLMRSRRQV